MKLLLTKLNLNDCETYSQKFLILQLLVLLLIECEEVHRRERFLDVVYSDSSDNLFEI